MSKKASLIGSTTDIPLMDTERDVFDPLCSLNLMELHQNVLAGQIDSLVYTAAVKSGLFITYSSKELMERNNEVVALKEMNARLQTKLDSHVCTILV